jgi:septum formation protein
MKKIFLASQSPRRSQLLEKAGISFQILPITTSENVDKKLMIDTQILSITRQKLVAAEKSPLVQASPSSLIICADTEVIFENALMGKPKNPQDAQQTLMRLSGNKHFVKTGYIIKNTESKLELSHIETSIVYFKTLSEKMISDYIATGEPMDKAGSYGIQGLGGKFVEKFEGLESTIIGLPIERLSEHLNLVFGIGQ